MIEGTIAQLEEFPMLRYLPPPPLTLQHFILVSVIWLVYMAGHAGWSSPFRFADA